MVESAKEASELAKFMNKLKDKTKGDDQNDIDNKCLDVCQTYLAGDWLNINTKDIEVKRLTGGMTNQIYQCKAINNCYDVEDVVIRLYGEKYDLKTFEKECPTFYDGIVALLVSMEKIGPHIYGVFEQGQVMLWYKVRFKQGYRMDNFTEEGLECDKWQLSFVMLDFFQQRKE